MNEQKPFWADRRSQLLLAVGLVLVAIVGRLMPHPPNMTPVAGAALLAGSVLARRYWALAVPLLAMLASDMLIGFHSWGVLIAVYVGLALPALLGRFVSRGPSRYLRIGGLAFLGAVSFFIISNLGVFAFTPHYPPTWGGLAACFAAAIPFFKYTLLGDLVWAVSLFAVFDAATYYVGLRRGAGSAQPLPA